MPFDEEEYDYDYEVLARRRVKALRKPQVCWYCAKIIEKGSGARVTVLLGDRTCFSQYHHDNTACMYS